MRLAFVLDHLPLLRVPGVRPHASLVVDGHACVVPDFRAAQAFGKILVHLPSPLPGEVHLRERRSAKQSQWEQQKAG
jgi:hypothetical protein